MTKKSAIITGAASGIGYALAKEASARGYNVALADIDSAGLASLKQEISGVECIISAFDVANKNDVDAFVSECVSKFSRIDLLFNNAGVMAPGKVNQQTLDDFKTVFDVNFFGVLNMIQSFLPHMTKQDFRSRIVNTASISGLLPSPFFAAYNSSKHAVVALSETLHFELQKDAAPVDVSVLAPGAVATSIMKPQQEFEFSTEMSVMMEKMHARTEKFGMSPKELAHYVFEEINNNQYWIFPHEEYLQFMKARNESMIDRATPEFKSWVDTSKLK